MRLGRGEEEAVKEGRRGRRESSQRERERTELSLSSLRCVCSNVEVAVSCSNADERERDSTRARGLREKCCEEGRFGCMQKCRLGNY